MVDLQIAPLGLLASREEVMDYAYPFYSEYTAALYRKPKLNTKVTERLRTN